MAYRSIDDHHVEAGEVWLDYLTYHGEPESMLGLYARIMYLKLSPMYLKVVGHILNVMIIWIFHVCCMQSAHR